jgi:poly(3-hydroxyalkanoate) synthetase
VQNSSYEIKLVIVNQFVSHSYTYPVNATITIVVNLVKERQNLFFILRWNGNGDSK